MRIEHAQNFYPPLSLENTTHFHPQG
jgi:hypothetical protein